ncbi:hypothetical protein A2U01_0058740, partial [Trifolium medium]|nr:hypothetical protein [Trifolium medium]
KMAADVIAAEDPSSARYRQILSYQKG